MAVLQQRYRRPAQFGLAGIWNDGQGLLPQTGSQRFFYHLSAALRGMRRSPLTTVLTLLTTAIVFSLIGFFLLVAENLGIAVEQGSRTVTVSVYLDDKANSGDLDRLTRVLKGVADVTSVRFISKNDALEEFRVSLGADQSLLDGLEGQNPLPASFEVQFASDPQVGYQSLKRELASDRIVSSLQFNESLARQMSVLSDTLRARGRYVVVVVLILAAFIIGNTLTLSLHAHRDEIEIMKLVGAHRSFIRGPYLVEGMAQGGFGSFLGVVVVYALYSGIFSMNQSNPFIALALAHLQFLSFFSMCLIILCGVAVGYVGSRIAVGRYESRI